MSAVSKKLMPASSAASTTAAVSLRPMRMPKLLQPRPTTLTCERADRARLHRHSPSWRPVSCGRTGSAVLYRRLQVGEPTSDEEAAMAAGAVDVTIAAAPDEVWAEGGRLRRRRRRSSPASSRSAWRATTASSACSAWRSASGCWPATTTSRAHHLLGRRRRADRQPHRHHLGRARRRRVQGDLGLRRDAPTRWRRSSATPTRPRWPRWRTPSRSRPTSGWVGAAAPRLP